ncbi:alpha/beta hydrolase [Nitratireductor luteus]|uniref:alpha/beta hydrolase n=1 Tax=Nitratireductor luteus TaxID=2976980 RepID=UPI0030844F6E
MKAADGLDIRYGLFPNAALNGTIVLLPGRNESIEKYFETIGDLAKRGFACAMLDWRGQGGSGRLLKDPRKGHIERFDDYVADLDQFFTEIVLPDCRPPFHLMAHSMGALIALLAAQELVNRVRRMILLAPPLDFSAPLSMPAMRRVTGLFYVMGLGSLYAPGGRRRGGPLPFDGNRLSSDRQRFARNQAIVARHPDLAMGGPTAAWVHAACVASDRVRDPDFMAAIRVPILFLAAGTDSVVSTSAIERYARGLRSASALTVDGARHELLQEDDFYREQVLAAATTYILGAGAAENRPLSLT